MRRALFFALALTAVARGAETVAIAAAANLIYALDALDAAFQRASPGVSVSTTTGASGNLFAQIRNGAPFDVFLSADTEYPRQLAAADLGDSGTLRTFATGRLVLWTTRHDLNLYDIATLLRSATVKKIAIAQPRTAPYGRAAQAALTKLGVWTEVQPKLVIGENISQTAQFIQTGNADVGFVALSLVISGSLAGQGQWREVAPALYAGVPLDHAAVLTRHGAANPAARRFLDFLTGETAQDILHRFGYATPAANARATRAASEPAPKPR
jgi:molybdate transport system substrate-binding protein